MDVVEFVTSLRWEDLPDPARERAKHCLLDLVGVALAGARTDLSRIIRTHVATQFGGPQIVPFDGRRASAAGVALALGMTIDAVDGHDGYNPAKGHVGCGLFPGLLALARDTGMTDSREFLAALVLGYEIGSRLGVALHATTPDYHTSGAWVAVAVAGTGARLLGLPTAQISHAMGIAEYHGPRSQMMRCIDHPTMLKDGSGWGAMAGVSAVLLARDGFTGAPALTITTPREIWADLGTRWLIDEQYFKPYPVCRWAQPAVEAVLTLRRDHALTSSDVDFIEVATFHESTRLATATPQTTEEAQYSTSFPAAVAMVRGRLTADDIDGPALTDREILRLSKGMVMSEHDHANAQFPSDRLARVTLHLTDGRTITSDWMRPLWDKTAPPTVDDLRAKFETLATPVLGARRADDLARIILNLERHDLSDFDAMLCQPINRATTA